MPQSCITQINKRIGGFRSSDLVTRYNCEEGSSASGTLNLDGALYTGSDNCDRSDLLPQGSRIFANGAITWRKGDTAQFVGKFNLQSNNRNIFIGNVVMFDRVATNFPPMDNFNCDQRNHIEGWFEGRGRGPYRQYYLRSLIAGRGIFPRGRRRQFVGVLSGLISEELS